VQINVSDRGAVGIGTALLIGAAELAWPGTLMSIVAWVQSLVLVIA